MSSGAALAQFSPRTRFALDADSEAGQPPERRGVARDGVRLLVARPDAIEHRLFHELPDLLEPGDLLVINTSATLPAAVDAKGADGRSLPVHVSSWLDDGRWVVELRRPDGSGPMMEASEERRLLLPAGLRLTLDEPYPDPYERASRLWIATPTPATPATEYLQAHGRPIEYRYLVEPFPLGDHQTVYAVEPGSAEMPSAGRPFTEALLVRLIARGVAVAPLVLHAGVSSFELHEPPPAERFAVPEATARLVASTKRAGGRVIAVGTTVVRALESTVCADRRAQGTSGWTDLVLGPGRPARLVDALLTGLHAPEASHLLMLEALAPPALLQRAYEQAVAERYLWHEFGDSMLIVP